jgi:hypothetical protein
MAGSGFRGRPSLLCLPARLSLLGCFPCGTAAFRRANLCKRHRRCIARPHLPAGRGQEPVPDYSAGPYRRNVPLIHAYSDVSVFDQFRPNVIVQPRFTILNRRRSRGFLQNIEEDRRSQNPAPILPTAHILRKSHFPNHVLITVGPDVSSGMAHPPMSRVPASPKSIGGHPDRHRWTPGTHLALMTPRG